MALDARRDVKLAIHEAATPLGFETGTKESSNATSALCCQNS